MKKISSLTGIERAFLGFQHVFDDAEVVVIPVPYDATSSYGVGSRFAPNAIIDASTQLELYDIESKRNICEEITIHTLDELIADKGSPDKTIENVRNAVRTVVDAGKKPLVFGGEHSISAGAVAGLKNPKSISVLQIDAHSDLRNSYKGTKYNHACAMARIREIAGNTVQVGIRSMCNEEAEYIEEKGIEKTIFYARDLIRNRDGNGLDKKDIERIISQLNNDVYVTVDVDGFDPSVFPGTGTPEPGGLEWYDVLSLMETVGKKRKVVGFDIVEVLPTPPSNISEFAAAKLVYKMIGYFWMKK